MPGGQGPAAGGELGGEEPPSMLGPMDTIILSGIRALGAHGVLPEEQARPQPFEVDLELSVDLSRAGRSDVLSDTIDYDGLAAQVVQIVEAGGLSLLEALADRIATACRVDP